MTLTTTITTFFYDNYDILLRQLRHFATTIETFLLRQLRQLKHSTSTTIETFYSSLLLS
jgi:hypothetical protein